LVNIKTVSIVDDDDAVRAATQTFVRSLGYRAVAFASAEDFLKSPELATADSLIADIHMPGMSGIDLQRELIDRRPELPIIFITAFPEERVRDQLLAAGAVGMLSKPYDGDTLIEYIEKALARKALGFADRSG
jgi:FixJ family two-component response regulator